MQKWKNDWRLLSEVFVKFSLDCSFSSTLPLQLITIMIYLDWNYLILEKCQLQGVGWGGGVMQILIPGQCKDLFSSFLLDVKSRHKLENKNSTLAWFGGAGLAPEVWYILVFLLLFFLHKWYILISILIYFESLFDMGWWLFICRWTYIGLFTAPLFAHCCNWSPLIDIDIWQPNWTSNWKGLHISQKGKRTDDFKSYFQHAKTQCQIL